MKMQKRRSGRKEWGELVTTARDTVKTIRLEKYFQGVDPKSGKDAGRGQVWGYLQNATLYAMAAMSRRITTSS